ncbi:MULTISPECIES: NADH:flavin oxidoreductase [Acidiplasma]|jgi:2,4-dienoyl-CoA reductase-like NADH-dependent reductase (Old Yellow Enzyme family)|uniref:NADH:flavin oxidoreductase n=2 Tax=Acidiplasma TaxID=507753 RepID=A0A0Q0XFZ5_9ARCH|nr:MULTISPECIES: NADH:flavin oxidoreductase [Acidiplasma]KQB33507.1 NADH:flavin oxidoreductase [Acidiplasma cupricumulans]KQB33868.1 NADH:flavin oxidoreductase [Acidiplasma aeolicum]
MDVFSTGTIGNLEIKNRLVMAPMISNLASPDGNTNEDHIAYLEERARGGYGLIITEYTYVDELNGKGSPNQLGMFSYSQTPKFFRLTERMHKYDSRIFVQLVHSGAKALQGLNTKKIFAPTAMDYMGNVPQTMSIEDIINVQEKFYRAADIAYKSGFDGIELHGAHGYLLEEFISPALNKRDDKYGGSLENRLRIINEMTENIKNYYDIPLGIRLSLYENDPDGYGPDYGLKVGESIRKIDYIHYSAGRFAPPASSAPFYYEHNHIYARLPRRPDKTTILVGSVINAADANEILKKADFVATGREALADPYFPYKLLHGHNPRPCIRCNQDCRRLGLNEVRCTVNIDTGLELYSTIRRNKKLIGEIEIDGAGIKGLEAALYALSLGLKPVIYEENVPGGQINDILEPHKRTEFKALVDYYLNELDRRGITVEKSRGTSGIDCSPDKVYPDIKNMGDVSINTNIYRYFDDALEISKKNTVIINPESLEILERSRREFYIKLAERQGIKFIKQDSYNINIFDKNQYDIRSAMISGRRAVDSYIMENYDELN